MTKKFEIVAATEAHARQLARTMRQADVDEIWASGRLLPLEALMSSFVVSREPRAWLVDGFCVCMFGVAQHTFLSTRGVPWLLTGEGLEHNARRFMRGSREFVEEQMEKFDILVNQVDARHETAIRWLKWLGFTLEEAKPFGPDHMPFHRFTMTKED